MRAFHTGKTQDNIIKQMQSYVITCKHAFQWNCIFVFPFSNTKVKVRSSNSYHNKAVSSVKRTHIDSSVK